MSFVRYYEDGKSVTLVAPQLTQDGQYVFWKWAVNDVEYETTEVTFQIDGSDYTCIAAYVPLSLDRTIYQQVVDFSGSNELTIYQIVHDLEPDVELTARIYQIVHDLEPDVELTARIYQEVV